MTKRIFRSILIAALAVLLASLTLILSALYTQFTRVQQDQLRIEAQLAAQGVENAGVDYLKDLQLQNSRVTWIAADGTVLFDNQSDPAAMGSHGDRQEVAQALETGWGESVRHSDTLMQRSLYYALRLSDGSVLRLSSQQDTVLTLLLGMLPLILLVIGVALALSLILGARLSKKIVEPLNRLDLDKPLANRGYDELAPLLGRLHSQQQQLLEQAADLRRKQEEFDAVTENMREGLVLLGGGGRILSLNLAAARCLNVERACVGKDISEVCGLSQVHQLLSAAAEGRQAETAMELEGRSYHLDASLVCSDGTVTGTVLLIFDVTDKAQAEQLRREFTANVSHELKTPLHAISGYAELLTGGLVRAEDAQQFTENIYAESQRMIRLVEDILKLSQLDEGAGDLVWEKLDLLESARRTVEALEPIAQQAQVSLHVIGRSVQVEGIGQLVDTILHNLCDNAIKYNKKDGIVTVSISQTPAEAVLTVVDTGIGIPLESQERIFERFYRVDKSRSKQVGGTGLGLSIVKHAARILNARISLQSAPGTGTTVTVRFPKTRT